MSYTYEPPIVVLFAIEEEVDDRFRDDPCCQVVVTGVGKINASIFSLLTDHLNSFLKI